MYKKDYKNNIIRVRDNAFIPTDIRNVDFLDYLEWAELNSTPVDPVPQEITDLRNKEAKYVADVAQAKNNITIQEFLNFEYADLEQWIQRTPPKDVTKLLCELVQLIARKGL